MFSVVYLCCSCFRLFIVNITIRFTLFTASLTLTMGLKSTNLPSKFRNLAVWSFLVDYRLVCRTTQLLALHVYSLAASDVKSGSPLSQHLGSIPASDIRHKVLGMWSHLSIGASIDLKPRLDNENESFWVRDLYPEILPPASLLEFLKQPLAVRICFVKC
jgi:hypothetical protein